MTSLSLPISHLVRRTGAELSALIDTTKPATFGYAPQRIDLIGGLLEGQGGARCSMPLDRYLSILAQPRTDGQILIFDFNEYDQHRPFTLQIAVDALRNAPSDALRKNLGEPGRAFASPVIGALHRAVRSEQGQSLAAGVNLILARDAGVDPHQTADLAVAEVLRALAAPDDALQAKSSTSGEFGGRLVELLEESSARQRTRIELPEGVQVLAIPCVSATSPTTIDVAARMAHRLVLEKMRAFGTQAGRELVSDPMAGKIGNLGLDDYKRFFRGTLPEAMRGEAFLSQYGPDLMGIDPTADYAVQFVADHLVIEAHRVREFVRYLGEARAQVHPPHRKLALDKAGHLLYASHKSARDNCGFGHEEADRIVDAVRSNEPAGFFGAALSATSGGAWVGALCLNHADVSPLKLISGSTGVEQNDVKWARIGFYESSGRVGSADFQADFGGVI